MFGGIIMSKIDSIDGDYIFSSIWMLYAIICVVLFIREKGKEL